MTPFDAHRLLNAPTSSWVAYQQEHPQWGKDIAVCLRAKTLSPLAVTNNLRKLSDCMANPDIQPLLCDWLAQTFVAKSKGDKLEHVRDGLASCVRSMQLQAIHQGNNVNILPHVEHLMKLADALETDEFLWHRWLLTPTDMYRTSDKASEYFTNGQPLGNKEHLLKTLSQYQKFVVEAMATHPKMSENFDMHLQVDSSGDVLSNAPDDGTMCLSHALLWKHERLSMPFKHALARDWASDTSPWATQNQDRMLFPEQTQQWDAWAQQARLYIDVYTTGNVNFHAALAILKTYPLLDNKEKYDPVDGSVFSEGLVMLQ